MTLRRSMRRLASAMSAAQAQDVRFKLATVAAVTAGAAADGHDAVSVLLGADTVPAPYLDSYLAPRLVGDLVEVMLVNSSPLIVGRVIGLPDF